MMTHLLAPIACALILVLPSIEASAQPRRDDQDSAYAARQKGRVMSLREIEARVLPTARGAEYLGPEYDQSRSTYRLKFRRDVRVFWIDVDARNGEIVDRSDR